MNWSGKFSHYFTWKAAEALGITVRSCKRLNLPIARSNPSYHSPHKSVHFYSMKLVDSYKNNELIKSMREKLVHLRKTRKGKPMGGWHYEQTYEPEDGYVLKKVDNKTKQVVG